MGGLLKEIHIHPEERVENQKAVLVDPKRVTIGTKFVERSHLFEFGSWNINSNHSSQSLTILKTASSGWQSISNN